MSHCIDTSALLEAWVRRYPNDVFPGLWAHIEEVLEAFPRLVGTLKSRNRADAFVIALAKVEGLAVVTEERGGTPDRPRIPLICEHFKVPCINTLEFIRETGLTF